MTILVGDLAQEQVEDLIEGIRLITDDVTSKDLGKAVEDTRARLSVKLPEVLTAQASKTVLVKRAVLVKDALRLQTPVPGREYFLLLEPLREDVLINSAKGLSSVSGRALYRYRPRAARS
ncbi:hypothetical protein [Frondihabitans sp. PAMC 28766]|uniref:hypothetical protein n=1 Tax=Frondihabitans sp. PAMC 28766 TaxID=1795630 RepID=UPI0012FF7E3A|nr:hypothetical protein [Frondihabitans sp. PAMC 28766]